MRTAKSSSSIEIIQTMPNEYVFIGMAYKPENDKYAPSDADKGLRRSTSKENRTAATMALQ